MITINDGGPAFPHWQDNHYTDKHPKGGMSLRDYFAAKAMAALVTAEHPMVNSFAAETLVANASYKFADAMLRAREQS